MVNCYPLDFLFVNIALACLDALLAFIAFFQLSRIHLRNQQVGWTRQKVLHLMIASSNFGGFAGLMCVALFSWPSPRFCFWLHFFLSYLSGSTFAIRQMMKKMVMRKIVVSRLYWKVQRARQVIMLNIILMISFAATIWIAAGKNPSYCLEVARVYIDFFAASVLILGGAFGCYGFLLFSKLRRVRSEKASSEMWKVVGLAAVSVLCFTSSSLIALLTDIPLFHHWNLKKINGVKALVLLICYYVLGSSVPFAFVLWFMRELPAPSAVHRKAQPRATTFVSYGAEGMHQHHGYWATATSSSNQVSRASPT